MVIIKENTYLSKLKVKEALRREVVILDYDTDLYKCISKMIKHKVNAVLVKNKDNDFGIVSKTDIVMAYYSNISLNTIVSDIMIKDIFSCNIYDDINKIIDIMVQNDIKQIVVMDPEYNKNIGIVCFSDVVGVMYRYCFNCDKNKYKLNIVEDGSEWFKVLDVMSRNIKSIDVSSNLYNALEILLGEHIGALPVVHNKEIVGVISKTDLILSYKHNLPLVTKVSKVMSSPPVTCSPNMCLSEAIKLMILTDVERLFVVDENKEVVGVLSFTDAAKFRSGSCKACKSGRWF